MSVIVAVEMSSQPFKTFQFDGILGLGLPGLTMNRREHKSGMCSLLLRALYFKTVRLHGGTSAPST